MKRKNYKLIIQYDGSDFHGWQVQRNERTVQGDIEGALSMIYPTEKINLIGAGRTDAGVHSTGQVANVNLPVKFSFKELQNAINGNLEKDVRINKIQEAKDKFHARFSASSREYSYHFMKSYNPVNRKYKTLLKWDVNHQLLNDCSDILLGEHNFTTFCKSTSETDNKICIINYAIWEDSSEELMFRINANRFLQHMVRYLVGTMIEVAKGRYTLKNFNDLINNEETKAVVVRAPAQGLFLKEIFYDKIYGM